MSYIFERLTESSTWRGIMFLLTALGVHINPEQSNAIIIAGTAVIGAVSVFLPDSFKKKSSGS
jgi:hypothetical protein